MSNYSRRKKKNFLSRLWSFAAAWAILNMFFPVYRLFGFLLILLGSSAAAFAIGRLTGRKEDEADSAAQHRAAREAAVGTKRASERVGEAKSGPVQSSHTAKSYGPEIDPIVQEGNRAMQEMGRLYSTIKDPDIRIKINEIMRITDKITQDAIEDPSDIPQIKKFFRYYLPTTIKLLNAYDRMSSQGIEGENIDKSIRNINEMLDVAIEAYKKRLDSLFENQALDIETDIDVMNQMLAREGLTGGQAFSSASAHSTHNTTGCAAAQQKG